MLRRLSAVVILLTFALPASAETLSCPAMTNAVQVGSCPTDAELEYSFTGYCSDNARMQDKDIVCTDIALYREIKDNSLWESGDFHGYLTCTKSEEQIRAAKPVKITVSKALGTMSRVACSYDNGTVMATRTRKTCSPSGETSVTCE